MGQWMRVFETVTSLVQMSGRFRQPDAGMPPPGGGPLGQLETRLAGVVVAALKEAFDRDRARMDLERTQMDGERRRAEEALRAELRRQAAERALGQLRMVAVMAFGLLMTSAALVTWLPGMRTVLSRALVGTGWALAIAALGSAFVAWQAVSAWSSAAASAPRPSDAELVSASGDQLPVHPAASTAPWLLLGALALTSAALLSAL
jgi:hypothetical protein